MIDRDKTRRDSNIVSPKISDPCLVVPFMIHATIKVLKKIII